MSECSPVPLPLPRRSRRQARSRSRRGVDARATTTSEAEGPLGLIPPFPRPPGTPRSSVAACRRGPLLGIASILWATPEPPGGRLGSLGGAWVHSGIYAPPSTRGYDEAPVTSRLEDNQCLDPSMYAPAYSVDATMASQCEKRERWWANDSTAPRPADARDEGVPILGTVLPGLGSKPPEPGAWVPIPPLGIWETGG